MTVNPLDPKVRLSPGMSIIVARLGDGDCFFHRKFSREADSAANGMEQWSISIRDKLMMDWLLQLGGKVILVLTEVDGTRRYRMEYHGDLLEYRTGPREPFWLVKAGALSEYDGRVVKCS
jgi:hypothetical protein